MRAMIPRSLQIALVIGLAGGAITALVLASVRDGQAGIEFVEGPSVTVLTDGADYKKSAPVTIRIVNSGDVQIQFADPSYGLQITGLAGMPVFSQQRGAGGDAGTPSILEPGRDHTLVWDQTNNDRHQVFDGIYRISVHGFDPDGGRVEGSATISIYEADLTFGS